MKYFTVTLCVLCVRKYGNEDTTEEFDMTNLCGEHTPKIGESIVIKKDNLHCKIYDIIHYYDNEKDLREIKLFGVKK